MATTTQKGDTIVFDPSTSPEISISWLQQAAKKEAKYRVLTYEHGQTPNRVKSAVLFVQSAGSGVDGWKKFLDKTKTITHGKNSIVVSDDFQFGQSNDGKMRFLVFHDKANKPYQHRFIETTAASNVGSTVVNILSNPIVQGAAVAAQPMVGAGLVASKQYLPLIKGIAGHPLRDFIEEQVTLGDTLKVNVADHTKQRVEIQWRKSGSAVKTPYFLLFFTNNASQRLSHGFIFVSEAAWTKFVAGKTDPEISITVNKDYQYGQKEANGLGRFLVFHHIGVNDIFQDRFFEAIGALGPDALSSVGSAVPQGAKSASFWSGLSGTALKSW